MVRFLNRYATVTYFHRNEKIKDFIFAFSLLHVMEKCQSKINRSSIVIQFFSISFSLPVYLIQSAILKWGVTNE